MSTYILTTAFSFGKYQGQTLKGVYLKDPQYIDWCMANHDAFCLNSKTLEYMRNLKSYYFSKEAFTNNLNKVKNSSSSSSSKSNYTNNSSKTKSIKSYRKAYTKNSSDNDYESDNGSYSKYGGYNGYDDSAIDNAFEGDPSLTWNCD